jgi:hypothetical protein
MNLDYFKLNLWGLLKSIEGFVELANHFFLSLDNISQSLPCVDFFFNLPVWEG